ncbi:MAG TPA: adenosine deaminase [Alphaproteobacteria bacterium]|jgi:adenosine deaminase|nr:adenosine deaminase [Alphaproteobacteria bacterium]
MTAAMVSKAELHVHLEGTATPELVRRLAERHGMTLPPEMFGPDGDFVWRDFLDFLDVYDSAAAVIRTPEDYRDLTLEYLLRSAAEGAIYIEMMSSPDHAAENGLNYTEHLEGIAAGIEEARAECGIEGRIIVTCVRHFGTERGLEIARQVVAQPHPLVVGFGMGGDEAAYPAGDFTEVFDYVAAAGMPCTVHAGEWAGPESVSQAMATLPVGRLGHGVRAIEDPGLVSEIAARGLVLEVCPGSNLATGVFPSAEAHPFNELRRAGVAVTLNSDDPPYFATSIGREYDFAASHFGLDEAELRAITRTALEAAFVDAETKAALLVKLES